MSEKLQNFAKFPKFQLDTLVDSEKCCQTRIYLQRSAPIQLKTSEILPKICQTLATGPPAPPPGSSPAPAARELPAAASPKVRRGTRPRSSARLYIVGESDGKTFAFAKPLATFCNIWLAFWQINDTFESVVSRRPKLQISEIEN